MSWPATAACAGADVDLFFSAPDPTPALDLCRVCPVRVECLETELAVLDGTRHTQHHGVIGGTLPAERHDRRHARLLALHGRPEWRTGAVPAYLRVGRPPRSTQERQRDLDARRDVLRAAVLDPRPRVTT